jgi:hypothetical protein
VYPPTTEFNANDALSNCGGSIAIVIRIAVRLHQHTPFLQYVQLFYNSIQRKFLRECSGNVFFHCESMLAFEQNKIFFAVEKLDIIFI